MTEAQRRIKERERLRAKRRNPAYLAKQRNRRAAQMRAVRHIRKRKGLCNECDRPKVEGFSRCAYHLASNRTHGWYA